MDIKTIKTEEQHEQYLVELRRLMDLDPSPDSAEGVQLELLAEVIEEYEVARWPIPKPDPEEAVRFRLEQQ